MPLIERNREAANAKLAETVYAQLEKEGFFEGWRKESRTPRIGAIVGGGHTIRKPEPVKETFLDIAALAHEWKHAPNEAEKKRIARRMDEKVSELNEHYTPSNALQTFYRNPKFGHHSEQRMIAIRMALQSIGYPPAKAKELAIILYTPTSFYQSLGKSPLHSHLEEKTDSFLRAYEKYARMLRKK